MGDDTKGTAAERRQKAGKAAQEEAEYLLELAEAQESDLEFRKLIMEATEKQIRANKLLGKSYSEEEAVLSSLKNEMNDFAKANRDFSEEGKKAAKTLAGMVGMGKKFEETLIGQHVALIKGTGGLKGFAEGMKEMANAADIGGNLLNAVAQASLKLLWDTEKSMVGFNKATGQLDRYGAEIRSLNADMFDHGVSIADAAATYEDLVKNVTDLNVMTKTERESISQTTALLDQMGVAGGTTAANIQFMTKSLGIGAKQSAKYQRELFTLAKEIGMPASEMAEQFKAAGPKMAEFGKQAGKVFKDLAVNARRAGMEVSELLDITGKFDTFEGAAESVGQLNAILGGPYLNSMDMVMETDPTKRMQMLSSALNRAGKSFEDMTYYEKKSVAAAAGFKDVEQLAKTMANEFDGVAGSTHKSKAELEKLAEDQKNFNTLAEEMSQFMRAFAVDLYAVLQPLKSFLQMLQNGIQKMNELGKSWGMGENAFGKFIGTLGAGLLIYSALKKLTLGWISIKKAWSAATTVQAFVMGGLTKATKKQEEAQKSMGESGKMSGKSLLSFGAAILMIGAGIGLAAYGVAQLAAAFAQLHGEQIVGAAAAIALFGLTVAGTLMAVGAMAAGGPQAVLVWAAVGVIVALGLAAMMAGKGVELLGKGLSSISEAFVSLSAAFTADPAIWGMPAWLQMMALSLAGFAIAGLAAIPAMLGLSNSTGKMVKKLEAKAKFTEAQADLNRSIAELAKQPADGLEAIAVAMEKIVDQMERVPTHKIRALSKLFAATAAIDKIAKTASTASGGGEASSAALGGGASGTSSGVKEFHISLNFKGREVDKQVIQVVGDHMKHMKTD